jgi:hypothetical protein
VLQGRRYRRRRLASASRHSTILRGRLVFFLSPCVPFCFCHGAQNRDQEFKKVCNKPTTITTSNKHTQDDVLNIYVEKEDPFNATMVTAIPIKGYNERIVRGVPTKSTQGLKCLRAMAWQQSRTAGC